MNFLNIFSQLKKWHLVIVLGIVNLGLIAGAFFYYNSEKERIRNAKIDDLEAISQLKINQITQWSKERLSEAEYFANNDNFVNHIKNILQNKNAGKSQEYFNKRLIHFKKNKVYENIFISSAKGEILFTLDSLLKTPDSLTINFTQKAIKQKKLIFTDFYYSPIRKKINYNIISPVFDAGNVIAAIVFVIDPDDYLYPAIKSWPVQSRSAETIVIRKEGNYVLFLSELRNNDNIKLTFKIPITRKEVLAIKGILGEKGITEGKDYRGKEILGDIQEVPGTSWVMISKIDIDEVYEEISYLKILLGILTIVLILLIGSGVTLIYEYSQSTLYKKMYLNERDLNKTREELRTTLYSIGDGVITTDITGQVARMNPVAESLTGWKENTARGKFLSEVFKIIDEKTESGIECPVEKTLQEGISKSLTNNTILISSNSRRTPISYSSSPIKNEENKIIGAVLVFRNETKEYRAKKLLKESEAKFSKIFHNSPVGISIAKTDGTLLDVNQIFLNETGFSSDEIIGKTSVSLSLWKNLKDRERFIELLSKNSTVPKMEADFRMKSGEIRTCFISAELLSIENQPLILSSIIDITDRKIFETAFQKTQLQLITALELAHLGHWEYDIDYDLFTFNDQFYKMLRTSAEKEGGYTMSSSEYAQRFVHPDDINIVGNEIRKVVETEDPGYSSELEHRIKYADGDEGVITVRFNIIKDKDNRTIKVFGVNQDITQRILSEKSLHDKEELLNDMGKTAKVGGWEFDIVTSKGTWTEQVAHIHDLDPSLETNVDTGLRFYTPESRSRIEKAIKEAIELQKPYDLELELISAKGIHKWVRTIGKPVIENGKVVRMRGSFQDITDRRNAEETIRASEKKFATAFHISPDSVNINRMSDGLYIDVNEGFCKVTGYTKTDILRKTSAEINIWVNKEDRNLLVANLTKFGEVINMEAQFRTRDGSIRTGLMSAKILIIDNEECILSITRDITERKEAEKLILKAREFAEQVIQTANVIFLQLDASGKVLKLNKAAEEITGYERFEIEGKDWGELLVPRDRFPYVWKIFDKIMTNNEIPQVFENPIITKSGEERQILWKNSVIREGGKIVSTISFGMDITERKKAEQRIKESELRFRQLFEKTDKIPVQGYDKNHKVIYWNKASEKAYGFTKEEAMGKYLEELIIPNEFREIVSQGINDWHLKDIPIPAGEVTLTRKDGRCVNMFSTHIMIKNIMGEKEMYCVDLDLTEKNEAQRKIQLQSLMLNSVGQAVIATDLSGNIIFWNNAAENLYQWQSSEAIGQPITDIIFKNASFEYAAGIMKNGKEWSGKLIASNKYGDNFPILLTLSPFYTEHQQLIGTISICADLSDQVKREEELQEAKEQAEEMNRIKSYFYANISHELRTPFVGIMGYAELLKDTLADPEEKEMAEVILNSSKRLTDTLNKILSITKLEFDKAEINLQSVDIFTLIKNLQVLYSKSAQQQNTRIRTSFRCKHFFIKTDENLIQEILSNLVNNAVKFTTNGEIELIASIREREGKNYFVVKVKDTGIGISKDKQDLIWLEFRQASEGLSRSFEGTGLGLSIAKRYANLLDGNITLDSEPGKGSTFTVELPLIEVPAKDKIDYSTTFPENIQTFTETVKERLKILYVEDDPVSMNYIKKVLLNSYDLDEAVSGDEAIEKIKNNTYSALLVDINLGVGMNGVELTQVIRQQPDYKSIPIIAITAYASANDRDEFLSKGFSHHLAKPFVSADLLELLECALKEKAA